MKNRLILIGAVLASALTTQAFEVYSTDFDLAQEGSSNAVVLGGRSADVVATEWFGSTNEVGIDGGRMSFSNGDKNRYRGVGVWLDTSTWGDDAATVTVEFDVTGYVEDANTTFIFETFAANSVDGSNSVSLDLHESLSNGAVLAQTGSARIAALGSAQTITSNGSDQTLTFDYDGTDQYIALVFAQVNSAATSGKATVDNLRVSVPEPGTFTLLAGLSGLVFAMSRRR